jgi:hypothetical protein
MASRVIMRIELSSEVRPRFESTPELLGMTQIAVTSKIIEWLLDQSEIVQNSILGLYPEIAKGDLTAEVLRRFISHSKKRGNGQARVKP